MSMTLGEAQGREARPTPDTPSNVLQQLSMRGKVVAITGAADGIGLAVAEAMAEAGGDVALLYNSNDAAVARAAELASTHGVRAKAYRLQVTDPAAVEATIGQVAADFGRLDVFVANAGMAISKPILEQTLDEYRSQMAVNVDGVFYCAKYAGEIFRRQGKGNLIITSSMSAHIVNVPISQPVYNGTKAYVSHLGKSLAVEWASFFDTKMGASPAVAQEALRMTAAGRFGNVKELKGVYLYLASDASSFTTGSEILVDGGYVLP